MDSFIATFKAPDWVDEELMQMYDSAQIRELEVLPKLQAPIAHHIVDALRDRGLKVGEPKWIHYRLCTDTDVEVDGKNLRFSLDWPHDENKEEDKNAWALYLAVAYVPESPEQFLEPTPNGAQEIIVLEKLHQIMDEVLQRDPSVSHLEWDKE